MFSDDYRPIHALKVIEMWIRVIRSSLILIWELNFWFRFWLEKNAIRTTQRRFSVYQKSKIIFCYKIFHPIYISFRLAGIDIFDLYFIRFDAGNKEIPEIPSTFRNISRSNKWHNIKKPIIIQMELIFQRLSVYSNYLERRHTKFTHIS